MTTESRCTNRGVEESVEGDVEGAVSSEDDDAAESSTVTAQQCSNLETGTRALDDDPLEMVMCFESTDSLDSTPATLEAEEEEEDARWRMSASGSCIASRLGRAEDNFAEPRNKTSHEIISPSSLKDHIFVCFQF